MEVFSLHTSIQRFVAFGTYNLQKAIEKFISLNCNKKLHTF